MAEAMITLTIMGVDYELREKMLRQDSLNFYPENPRVYTLLDVSSGVPDQDLIERTMKSFDHVKQLKTSIKDNGGLIDPLIVRGNVVLEGNSRLAAYRLLAEEDAIRWGYVKCQILPDNFPDSAVFALLGQYHVAGKTNWSPFEQANFLVRQIRLTKQPIEHIAKVLGIKPSKAVRARETYEFMEEYDDLTPKRWSYYEEYLKNRAIKNYRQTNPDFDAAIADQIITGRIKEATDIRDILGGIAKSKSREASNIMKRIVDGAISIYEGYDELEGTGKIGTAYTILKNFHDKIASENFEKQVQAEKRDQIIFQLKKIRKLVNSYLTRLENK